MKTNFLKIAAFVIIAVFMSSCSCNHSYTTVILEEATCGTPGQVRDECDYCGHEQYRDIPATGCHYYEAGSNNICGACKQPFAGGVLLEAAVKLNLRADHTSASELLAVVPVGTRFPRGGAEFQDGTTGENWMYVTYKGKSGWILYGTGELSNMLWREY